MRGSVRQRESGRWSYSLDIGRDPNTGRRRQRTRSGFKTKKAAEGALAQAKTDVLKGEHVEFSRQTTGDFLNEWLPSQRHRIAATTYASFRGHIDKWLIPAFGSVKLQALTPGHAAKLYAAMLDQGLSPATVKHVHVTLRLALKHAQRQGLIHKNPASLAAEHVPAVETPEMQVWTEAQARTFLAYLRRTEDRLYAAWAFLLATGVRRGEVLGLRWQDVDLDRAQVAIQKTRVMVDYTVQESSPKGKRGGRRKARTFTIDPETVSALRAWRKIQASERLRVGPRWKDTGLVFTMPDGSGIHPHRFSNWFKLHCRDAGLPRIRLHDLRHTHATIVLSNGGSLKALSERLGHASQQITADIYAHVTRDMHDQVTDIIGTALFG